MVPDYYVQFPYEEEEQGSIIYNGAVDECLAQDFGKVICFKWKREEDSMLKLTNGGCSDEEEPSQISKKKKSEGTSTSNALAMEDVMAEEAGLIMPPPPTMIVLSWNCREVASSSTILELLDLCKRVKVGLSFLIETKANK